MVAQRILHRTEEKIIVNRALRNDPSKEDMHNRQILTPRMLLRSLEDYDLWPVYIVGILFEIPVDPPKGYLTLTLKTIGFDTFQTTLLSIHFTVFAAINGILILYLTESVNQISILSFLA
jgi:hypothetical protein